MKKLYSIDKSYWLLPLGFGLGSFLFFLFFFPRNLLLLFKHFFDGFAYSVAITASLVVNLFVIVVLAELVCTRFKGLISPVRIKGILEECSVAKQSWRGPSIVLRISGRGYNARTNQDVAAALKSAMGKHVHITIGAVGRILAIEANMSDV